MGEGATDDRSDADLLDGDADAPWRPGYRGWDPPPSADVAPAPAGGREIDRDVDRDVDGDVDRDVDGDVDHHVDHHVDHEAERWSRREIERAPEPWVPSRPQRAAPRPPPASTGVPVVEVPGQPASATTGELVLAAILVVVLVAGAVVVGVSLRPSPGTVADPSVPVVAAAADTRWTVSFDGSVEDVGIGGDVVAVAVGPEIVVLDVASGEERWRLTQDDPDVDVDRVAIVGDGVVVQQRGATGRSEVRAFSLDAGTPVWDTVDADGVVTISGTDDDPLLFRRTQQGGEATLELVDASTGAAADPMRLSGITAAGDDIAVQPTDRHVAIWSRRDREVVTGQVDEFNLRMATPYADGIVALDKEGRLVLFDEDGRRADERPFVSDAFGEFSSRPELAGVVGGIGIVASGITVGFELSGGAIEPVWRREGRMAPPVATASGAFAVLVGPEPDGQLRESIVDPTDGSTLVVTDPDGKRERSPLIGRDAYVLAPTIGAPTRVVSAFGYDGGALWSLEVPAGAAYDIGHGVVVVVEREPTGSRVSLAR